ncbi:Fur-regulated basic protein FbpA [Rossellomorea marisflavi]|uniref:Fur-regulated basic protein FbpA n=1 Tax=Rossellomorea marisflavi TaxID=189381 RepID=UPI0034574F79
MRATVPYGQLRKGIQIQKDFYKSELLHMDYFKTPCGKQLYELTLSELEQVYENEKAKRRKRA